MKHEPQAEFTVEPSNESSNNLSNDPSNKPSEPQPIGLLGLGLVAAIAGLLLGLKFLNLGLVVLVGDRADALFQFANQPALGLLVGILTTALVQSSSAVSSIIVGLVATGMPVSTAIPIIMGANIGTTITNTLLSFGQVKERDRFERSVAAATVHDCFNLLAVALFLPLEITTHFLTYSSQIAAQWVSAGLHTITTILPAHQLTIAQWGLDTLLAPITEILTQSLTKFPTLGQGCILLSAGVALVLAMIAQLGRLLNQLLESGQETGSTKRLFNWLSQHPLRTIAVGTGITMIVQSSSTTTSLMIPLAASAAWELETIYPFTLGANIGTCATAILAALTVTGVASVPALQIALAHFLYNSFGVLVIYGVPGLRSVPLWGARSLARLAQRPLWLVVYVLGVFFVLPGLAIVAQP